MEERMAYKNYEPDSTPMAVLSDLLSKRDEEITILRELVRHIRGRYMAMTCLCVASKDEECKRCHVLGVIDKALRKIGEIDNG